MEVTSELLPFFNRDSSSKPRVSDKNVISRFTFSCPSSDDTLPDKPERDDDGDYLVRRRKDEVLKDVTISLEHGVSTELSLVGLQIWRGALLLADYLIHSRSEIAGQTVLELGAGAGLTSVVAGMYAKRIICTDVDRGDILKLLRHNLERNKEVIRGDVLVGEIDFCSREWSQAIADGVREVTVVLAADVIYDNDVTEAFVETLARILDTPPRKTLYLAMEKRYVFTLADLDTVAPCYEHLLTCLDEAWRKEPFSRWKIEDVTLDFPQYFSYDRVKELIMLKISS